MMFVSHDVSVRYLAGNSEATGCWLGTRNPPCPSDVRRGMSFARLPL